MKNKFQYLFILFGVIVVSGCAESLEGVKDDNPKLPEVLSSYDYQFHEGQTVLGDTIEIPYSIDNLRKAFAAIPPETKSGFSEDDLQPTHYYVRFSPKDENQFHGDKATLSRYSEHNRSLFRDDGSVHQ